MCNNHLPQNRDFQATAMPAYLLPKTFPIFKVSFDVVGSSFYFWIFFSTKNKILHIWILAPKLALFFILFLQSLKINGRRAEIQICVKHTSWWPLFVQGTDLSTVVKGENVHLLLSAFSKPIASIWRLTQSMCCCHHLLNQCKKSTTKVV